MPDATVKHQAAGIGRRVLSMLYEALVVLALSLFAGFIYHIIPVDRFTGESRRVFQLYLFLVLGAQRQVAAGDPCTFRFHAERWSVGSERSRHGIR